MNKHKLTDRSNQMLNFVFAKAGLMKAIENI
jgi:hypothetical protein